MSKDEHTCISSSFGKKEMIFCTCNGEEVKACQAQYDKFKKENYTESKGQTTFKQSNK